MGMVEGLCVGCRGALRVGVEGLCGGVRKAVGGLRGLCVGCRGGCVGVKVGRLVGLGWWRCGEVWGWFWLGWVGNRLVRGQGWVRYRGAVWGRAGGRLDRTEVSSLLLEMGVLGSPGGRPGTPVLTDVLVGPHTEHLLVSTHTAVPGQETEAEGTQTKWLSSRSCVFLEAAAKSAVSKVLLQVTRTTSNSGESHSCVLPCWIKKH